jgi:hypothetical protein
MEQGDLFAIGDPDSTEKDPHPATERFDVKQSFGERVWNEEVPDRSGCERSLLPGQAHNGISFHLGVGESTPPQVYVGSEPRRRRIR